MSESATARRAGLLLLIGVVALYPAALILNQALFGRLTSGSWIMPPVGSRTAPAVPEPPAIYRWLPPETRTVVTIRPRALFESPLARKHGLDRMRNTVWNGFRLGDLDTVVIGLPDQADLEQAFLVVEGNLDPASLKLRLREQYPSASGYLEDSVEVLQLNAAPERYVGLTVGGGWRIAVLDERTCLLCLGERQTLADSLNSRQQPLPRELAVALAERSPEEQASVVMLPPFMKAMRMKMDLNPILQAFPDLSQETYNPPSDLQASLAGCLRITGWVTVTDRVDGELQSLSERQADAEMFQKNLEYSLNLIRKASRVQLEGSPGLDGMVGEIDGFFRGLEVVREGRRTLLKRREPK